MRTHTKEKPFKIANITFAFSPFIRKKKKKKKTLKVNDHHDTLKSNNLDENFECTSRWFILDQRTQNLEFVSLKCVTYTQSSWVPLSPSPRQHDFYDLCPET